MKSFVKVPGPRIPRAFRPSAVKGAGRAEYGSTAIMDATGRPQLELGDIALLDARTTHAMKVALESVLRDVTGRFNLRFSIVRGVALRDRADFRIVVSVKS